MGTAYTFTTRDQKKLHVLTAIPEDASCLLLFIHGLGEHSGRYQAYFEYLTTRQTGCIGFDLRGHGKSDGRRGHAASYEYLLDDVGELIRSINTSYPEIPLFIYGHSMGGNIGLNYLLKRNTELLHGAVITSPWIELRVKPSSLKLFMAGLMHRIYPAYSEGNSVDPSHLTHDKQIAEAYASDPLVHDRISAGLFIRVVRAGKYALKHIPELKIPVLLIHGEKDPITSPSASAKLAGRNPAHIQFHLLPDMLHETHNEPNRVEVYTLVVNWLNQVL